MHLEQRLLVGSVSARPVVGIGSSAVVSQGITLNGLFHDGARPGLVRTRPQAVATGNAERAFSDFAGSPAGGLTTTSYSLAEVLDATYRNSSYSHQSR